MPRPSPSVCIPFPVPLTLPDPPQAGEVAAWVSEPRPHLLAGVRPDGIPLPTTLGLGAGLSQPLTPAPQMAGTPKPERLRLGGIAEGHPRPGVWLCRAGGFHGGPWGPSTAHPPPSGLACRCSPSSSPSHVLPPGWVTLWPAAWTGHPSRCRAARHPTHLAAHHSRASRTAASAFILRGLPPCRACRHQGSLGL